VIVIQNPDKQMDETGFGVSHLLYISDVEIETPAAFQRCSF